ncbi:MAG: class I SAM-dependent methyltransferase [Candidatus Bathyarchaeota archaeon]|nr:class I SAM-dependent methyltransferase [Candidatus Bathyarchaeota archaeon]
MAQWKQKRTHMRHYDQTAHLYNTRYAEEQSLKIKAALKSLKPETQSRCIDLGCGTGLLLPKIMKRAKNIVCLDMSKGMLKEVKPSLRHSVNVHLIQADADYTPLRHGYFNVAFAITLLQNTPNPKQLLQEMKRITKPDATMIITGLKKRFTQKSLLTLLQDAGFQTDLLNTDDNLKCHIASCKKLDPRRASNSSAARGRL